MAKHETEKKTHSEPVEEQKTEKKHHFSALKSNTKFWMYATGAISLILVFVLASGSIASGNLKTGEVCGNRLSSFLNEIGYSVQVSNIVDRGAFFEVTTSYNNQTIPVFMTKDCEFYFTENANITANEEYYQQSSGQQTQQTTEIIKTDKPVARAFVMSHCPYGVQFLAAYAPVIELLGDKADLYVNFVSYAMHGKAEIDDNIKMYCIQKEQKSKFVEFLNCFVQSENSTACEASANIDKAMLDTCVNVTDNQFNITGMYNDRNTWAGGSYPSFPIDSALNQKYGVQGSPTFVLNEQEISVSRTPEAIKEAICAAFKTPPAECNQVLSADGSAASGGCAT